MMNPQYRIEKIENRYNPEHDMLSGDVQVTWVDAELLELVKDLYAKIGKLEQEIKSLKFHNATHSGGNNYNE